MRYLLRKGIILIITNDANPTGDTNRNKGRIYCLFGRYLLAYKELFSHHVIEGLLFFSILHSYGLESSDCFDCPEVSNDLLLELH